MVGHGGSSAGSYLADSTSPIPSHCASIVTTSTVRVNEYSFGLYMGFILPRSPWQDKGVFVTHRSTQHRGWRTGLERHSFVFNSYCWCCVEVLGKLPMSYCLGQPSRWWVPGRRILCLVARTACTLARLLMWYVSYNAQGNGRCIWR